MQFCKIVLLFMFGYLGLRSNCEDVCWSTFGNYQYKILTPSAGMTFSEASAHCANETTSLSSIHSKDEDDFLQLFVMTQISVPVWIGLRRHYDTYTWTDGTDVDFKNTNYRRKTYSESCIYMFQGWIDEHCENAELYFICKRTISNSGSCTTTTELVPTTPTTTTATTSAAWTETSVAVITTGDIFRSSITQGDTILVTTGSTSSATTDEEDDVTENHDTITSHSKYTTITAKSSTSSAAQEKTSTEREMTFEELLDEMTVKEKPVYPTVEGKNSKAIGTVSMMILIALILGIILLDLSTIRKHVKLLKSNTKDICKRNHKTSVSLQMIEMNINGRH